MEGVKSLGKDFEARMERRGHGPNDILGEPNLWNRFKHWFFGEQDDLKDLIRKYYETFRQR